MKRNLLKLLIVIVTIYLANSFDIGITYKLLIFGIGNLILGILNREKFKGKNLIKMFIFFIITILMGLYFASFA